jgi:hypothetical protein
MARRICLPTIVSWQPGRKTIATFQGVGAQIYEYRAGSDGKLVWSFRESTAALI